MTAYRPSPIDTSTVQLPEDLHPLLETLAENVHDVWATGRLGEGWTWGPILDEGTKHHPGLVPYAQLSEGEKDYDRRTMSQSLRAILALGFRIEGPSADRSVTVHGTSTEEVLMRSLRDPAADLRSLCAAWDLRERDRAPWSHSSVPFCALAEGLLARGAPVAAVDVISEALETYPDEPKLHQLHGLALARTGAVETANRVMDQLYARGQRDEETLGLLARTHKDLAFLAASLEGEQSHLRRALALYSEAYERFPSSYWTGINASTVANLLGDRAHANATAHRVLDQCKAAEQQPGVAGADRFWLVATLAEAHLNLQDLEGAASRYREAATLGLHRHGDLNTTRRQARRLLDCLDLDPALAVQWLPTPKVVLFAGHMLDRPDRGRARFPLSLESAVRSTIADHLDRMGPVIGFASAANGGDLLFLETVLERSAEAHVVLSYDADAYQRDMVDHPTVSGWDARYRTVLSKATRLVVTSREKMNTGEVSLAYASMVLQGLAMLRAQELESEVVGLALWDGKKGSRPSGTSVAVQRWKELGIPFEILDIDAIRAGARRATRPMPVLEPKDDQGTPAPTPIEAPVEGVLADLPAVAPRLPSRVMCMIFADAVHFSKLTEEQVPLFVEHFLGATAQLLSRHGREAPVRNTWGDGLYVVFDNVKSAGLFALELARMANDTDWSALGLPATLNARIAVHAGPVFRCKDPVINRISYSGSHVSRAARIEPITPPGEVYASQAFAALATIQGVREFRCEFVKQAALAKNYGSFPTYVLRRARQVAAE